MNSHIRSVIKFEKDSITLICYFSQVNSWLLLSQIKLYMYFTFEIIEFQQILFCPG